MTIPVGARLGPYEVVGFIGAGGMGEVYRARDTRLGRAVALKVLPADVALDSDRRSRFEQEARSASALNHPNIVTVHDIGESDSTVYVAMEFVEGRTLREILAAGPMPIKKLLPVAAQAADGLARAHGAGIVHRDLKPENLMVTSGGFVKVLDFGLAKLVAPVSPEGSELTTMAGAPGTHPGVVLGTVGYMSPEQASGQPVDFRSDQFSLGAILYEMATGKRAFQKGTAVETLSAIIREDPEPIGKANPAAPAPLRWIVETCLAKDPEDRYASTRDLARDLRQAQTHSTEVSGEAVPVSARKPARRAWLPLLLAAGIALIAAGLWVRSRSGSTRPSSPTLAKVTFAPGLEDEPAWSPDGKLLAYTTDERGNLDVVVQPIAGGEPLKIAATEADEAQAAWSPDGSKLAFVSARDRGGRLTGVLGQAALANFIGRRGGDLFVVPALGGAAAKLVEDGHFPAWSPDGRRIVFSSERGGQWDLWVVPSDGGSPTRLTNDSEFDYQPSWSPDGRWIVYGSGTLVRFDIRVVPAEGGTPRIVDCDCNLVVHPSWSEDGKSLVYSGDRQGLLNVWRMPMSGSESAGRPQRVTVGAGADVNVAVARDGRVALATVGGNPDVWEWSLSSGELRQITSDTGTETHPQLSPDGKTLLFRSDRNGAWAIWAMQLPDWSVSRVTSGVGEIPGGARWSHDGRQITFEREDTIWIQSLGGLGARNTGLKGITGAWSPDGSRIAFAAAGKDLAHHEISVAPIGGGKAEQLTRFGDNAMWPTWSPDGKWIVYQMDRGGTRHLWLVPASGGESRQLTHGPSEESHPEWSPRDPDRILFLRNHARLFTLSVSTGKETPIEFTSTGRGPSSPTPLLGSAILDYPSWSPDGSRILFNVTRKTGDLYVLGGD